MCWGKQKKARKFFRDKQNLNDLELVFITATKQQKDIVKNKYINKCFNPFRGM